MIRIFVLALISSLGFSAMAFHLDDHARIAQQAYAEFTACFKNLSLDRDLLVEGDLDEDMNLVNKELFFSHYYNPHKKLKMWRSDSAGRIADLEPKLMQCRQTPNGWTSAELINLGHAVHHFQDMTVPSHVVPVRHSFWDGFETYEVKGDISSEWSCADIARATREEDLETILRETAEETLNAISAYQVETVNTANNKLVTVNGTEFWRESSQDGFGEYGLMGNSFGKTSEIHTKIGEVTVSEEAFRAFKIQQMKLAVRATLRGLAWAFLPPSSGVQVSQSGR